MNDDKCLEDNVETEKKIRIRWNWDTNWCWRQYVNTRLLFIYATDFFFTEFWCENKIVIPHEQNHNSINIHAERDKTLSVALKILVVIIYGCRVFDSCTTTCSIKFHFDGISELKRKKANNNTNNIYIVERNLILWSNTFMPYTPTSIFTWHSCVLPLLAFSLSVCFVLSPSLASSILNRSTAKGP